MGSVLKFRRAGVNETRVSKKKKKSKLKMGEIIIFPGIRRERHTDDYLVDNKSDHHEDDNKNAG